MPTVNRTAGRNVFIYDVSNPNDVLGGLILTNGVTNANFYSMIEILFIFTRPVLLRHNSNTIIQRDDTPLWPGNYYIVTTGLISVNNEPWLIRTVSQSSRSCTIAFSDAVRSRDRRCVITEEGPINADAGLWSNLQAAHVFPLAHKGHWVKQNFNRWITRPSASEDPINSVHNGLLLEAGVHSLFDSYIISINPDDDFKVVSFQQDVKSIAGKHLDQRFVDDPDRPTKSVLRWHFRQAVLANMRGAGEPIFEHDFPPGSDMIGGILEGPMAEKRMEFELFSRLAAFQDE
ncbi:MAG: hypothetical protein M1830_001660 [Pleopsidium flavum]|nr:MAG: hypothetical protein M1830_001660 [Pleopsidium flavum]